MELPASVGLEPWQFPQLPASVGLEPSQLPNTQRRTGKRVPCKQ